MLLQVHGHSPLHPTIRHLVQPLRQAGPPPQAMCWAAVGQLTSINSLEVSDNLEIQMQCVQVWLWSLYPCTGFNALTLSHLGA